MSYSMKNYKGFHIDGYKRLYWKTNKEQINAIINRLPQKYLKNLARIWHDVNHTPYWRERINHSILVRYDGCEFYVNANNIYKRLKK